MMRAPIGGLMILDNYELLDFLAQHEGLTTFAARRVSDSTNVIVHVMMAPVSAFQPRPELANIAESLFRGGQVRQLLDVGNREGKFYVVTEMRPECRDLRTWLEQQVAFDSSARSSAPQPSPPGEFTRMFQSVSPSRLDSVQDPMLDSTTTRTEPGREGDGFTTMFQSANPGSSPQVSSTPSPPQLTTMFKRSAPSDPTLPTGSFAAEVQSNREPAGAFVRTSAESAVVEEAPAGPSEYTRMISRPTRSPAPTPELPNSPADSGVSDARQTKPSYLPLILFLIGMLIAVVVVILYFALKS